MNQSWRTWKILMGVALGVLLLADAALIVVIWQSSREGAESSRAQRDRLALQAKLLKADVERGEKIRASLPRIGKDCDSFYQDRFQGSGTGYSTIVADLGELTTKAGVKSSGLTFQQKEVKDHGVIEIGIRTSVQGDYPAIIRFISDLEHSKNFYLLDNLHLDSASTGGIRLSLDLRTYFRT
ncbi:MAG TPA: GspMb/PilO family protein [Candidatus Limnocylindria bacterium]|nr:GspMb/PilO family protein [Candidatus Limnocylindria bacterium]